MSKGNKTVVVLGASNKPERYSHKAVSLLKEKGYTVIPVHPALDFIAEIPVAHSLSDISGDVHTLTIYLNPSQSRPLFSEIIRLHPQRVILNPGAESDALKDILRQYDISFIEACSLVLLTTDQF